MIYDDDFENMRIFYKNIGAIDELVMMYGFNTVLRSKSMLEFYNYLKKLCEKYGLYYNKNISLIVINNMVDRLENYFKEMTKNLK